MTPRLSGNQIDTHLRERLWCPSGTGGGGACRQRMLKWVRVLFSTLRELCGPQLLNFTTQNNAMKQETCGI
jgi:hypothetical protein